LGSRLKTNIPQLRPLAIYFAVFEGGERLERAQQGLQWIRKPLFARLGVWIAKAPEAYTYLIESIRRFPDQDAMNELIREAGFADVRYRNFDIACLHMGTKAS